MNRLKKLLLVAVGLAVIALVINLLDPTRSLTKLLKRESRLQAEYVQHFAEARPIEPIGSEEAKVRIKLLAQSMNPCHASTIEALKKIAEAVPERIRVEFLDTMTKAGFKARQQAAIPCEVGLLINGQKEFEIDHDGKKFPVSFHGPLGMGTSIDYLRMVVEQEIKKQYGKDLTDEERAKLEAVWKELPQMMQKAHGMGPGPMGPAEEEKPPASEEQKSGRPESAPAAEQKPAKPSPDRESDK